MQHLWGANTLCIPTFHNNPQSFKQSKTGKSRQNTNPGTNLAISNLVSDSDKYVNRETNIFTTVPASTRESTKTVTPIFVKRNLKIRGVDSLRGKLFTGGFSETASQLISLCDDQVQYQITICPEQSGLAGIMEEKFIHFDVIYIKL